VGLLRALGVRDLRARPLRVLLATLGIALGVALFVAIRLINRATVSSFREDVDAVAGRATLLVTAGEVGFPEEALAVIEKVPGVRHAIPLVETRGFLADEAYRGETLAILGVDLLREQDVRTYRAIDDSIIDDPLVFLSQPRSVILTRAFAEAHRLAIDSKLALATVRGRVELTVRGLLVPEGPATAYGGNIAIMDIDGSRVTFGREGRLDRVDVVTAEDADPERVAGDLRGALGAGYLVDRPVSRSAQMEDLVRSFQAMMSAFSLVALVVALFLVASTASITVGERRHEIGVLRAVGATRGAILMLVLVESAALGLGGALAGAFLGRGLATQMIRQVAQALSQQTGSQVQITRLGFGETEIPEAVMLGTFTAVLASLWSALRAARTPPLEALTQPRGGAARSGPGLWLLSALRPFVALLSRLSVPLAALAARNVLRHPKRAFANVLSLAAGVALVTSIATVGVSFRTTLLQWFSVMLPSDVLVSSYNPMPQYITFAQPLHEDLARELRGVPGVMAASTSGILGLRMIHLDHEGKRIALKAFDEPDPASGYTIFDLQDRAAPDAGWQLFHSPDPTAFVSSNFVSTFGQRTGDVIVLGTPHGPLRLRIAGVVTDFASPVGTVSVSRALYKRYWDDPLINIFSVSAAPGADPAALRNEIERRYARSKNLMALLTTDMRDALNRTLDRSFRFLDAVQWCALLIALLCVFNTLMIGVFERTREFGILRALGMRRRQIGALVLGEALLQGATGSLLGALAGLGLAYVVVHVHLPRILGWILSFQCSWSSILRTAAWGVLTALAAGAYPSFRASRLCPREALAHE
jgi:putative ABC transport system permease protein